MQKINEQRGKQAVLAWLEPSVYQAFDKLCEQEYLSKSAKMRQLIDITCARIITEEKKNNRQRKAGGSTKC